MATCSDADPQTIVEILPKKAGAHPHSMQTAEHLHLKLCRSSWTIFAAGKEHHSNRKPTTDLQNKH